MLCAGINVLQLHEMRDRMSFLVFCLVLVSHPCPVVCIASQNGSADYFKGHVTLGRNVFCDSFSQ